MPKKRLFSDTKILNLLRFHIGQQIVKMSSNTKCSSDLAQVVSICDTYTVLRQDIDSRTRLPLRGKSRGKNSASSRTGIQDYFGMQGKLAQTRKVFGMPVAIQRSIAGNHGHTGTIQRDHGHTGPHSRGPQQGATAGDHSHSGGPQQGPQQGTTSAHAAWGINE